MHNSTASLNQNDQRRRDLLNSSKQMVIVSRLVNFSKHSMVHFVAYECTFLMMYENQLKSKQTQRNMEKSGIPDLNLHPVENGQNDNFSKHSNDRCS